MFAKLVALILFGALVAAGMLSVRQQRLEAAHDMAQALHRAESLDRQLWLVRSEIATRSSPVLLREAIVLSPNYQPIPLEWCLPASQQQLPALPGQSEPATP